MDALPGGDLLIQAFVVAAVLSILPLGVSTLVGLLLSIFQAATQIQEQSLSFLPKLLAVMFTLWCIGGWITSEFLALGDAAFSIAASSATRGSIVTGQF